MKLIVHPSTLRGEVRIPGSKSHTIRAVVIATLAAGRSRIIKPLDSADTRSAIGMSRAFGANVETGEDWFISGTAGAPSVPEDVIDVGNSGTALRLGMGVAALCPGYTVFTGDHQIRRRPVHALIEAYRLLGAEGFTTRPNGCAPAVIRGRMEGGRTEIRAVTSQFLSSLLISTPLAEKNSEIRVLQLNEVPYVEMTLSWLDSQRITYERKAWDRFYLKGGQRYSAFDRRIPGDFSSATFFLCAAAVTGGELVLRGLDMGDVQGDKAVVGMLKEMGAEIEIMADGVRVKGGDLRGAEFDLNSTPDALPALAAIACFAAGETKLRNVPQARLKETDRIAVMAQELRRMGGDVEERADGLIIRGKRLNGALVSGHHDHRVVMALAVAGLAAGGETVINTAEATGVTFPDFTELMRRCGARMELVNE
ncbi:MAG: 3-phosphoshikimate 1-carboxyvinyltransferase [Candidatus Aureabacteria bacterium]|nr:3-phosphoshikimate 1-carboxyvinyltransferase [Candidatus Auribacterota bacterium]